MGHFEREACLNAWFLGPIFVFPVLLAIVWLFACNPIQAALTACRPFSFYHGSVIRAAEADVPQLAATHLCYLWSIIRRFQLCDQPVARSLAAGR
jgi:hypothetical protein